jgi:hypothetical protein
VPFGSPWVEFRRKETARFTVTGLIGRPVVNKLESEKVNEKRKGVLPENDLEAE